MKRSSDKSDTKQKQMVTISEESPQVRFIDSSPLIERDEQGQNSEDKGLLDKPVESEDDSSDISEQEQERQKEQQMREQIQVKQLNHRADNKVVIGTGFSMDLTDFFQFQKKKKLSSQGSLFQQISGSRLAWIILLYSVANGAMVPGWIMNIKATKFLRKTWRFLLQAIMIIPFVLYERRVADQATRQKYKLSYIFQPSNIKKAYISSLATAFWFTCILTSFEWTFISHAIVLGSLSNFFLSIGRAIRKSSHELESGGQILIIAGILLVFQDSIGLVPQQATVREQSVINPFYLSRTWWQRLLGDIVCLTVSFVMSEFSKYTSDMKIYYPPFLSMLLVNCFNSINLTISAYFFNGATFDFQSFWGVFSIFTQTHFAGFMYMAILLSLGQLISIVMISRMFPDPIIPALAMTLEPVFASFIVHLAGVQCMPGSFAFIGYLFIVPGLMLILTGQCLFQRLKSKKEEEEKKQREISTEMVDLKRLTTIREKKNSKPKRKKKQESSNFSHQK